MQKHLHEIHIPIVEKWLLLLAMGYQSQSAVQINDDATTKQKWHVLINDLDAYANIARSSVQS